MDQEVLHTVGFSVRLWLLNIAGFLLLLAMLRQWLWLPLRKVIDDRARRIADQLAEAQSKLDEAARVRAGADEYLAQKRAEAEKVAEAIVREARETADGIVAEARQEALEMRRQAERDALQAKLQALDAAKREAAALGAAMAEQLLKNVLDEERQRAVLEAAIADLEALSHSRGGET
ncbi:MAG: F0F1 ATP synthase subunit B [Armatimonadetes bacterium]|nr:F0F1 ATP synthase subunit B [Armatimonadota bacterium]